MTMLQNGPDLAQMAATDHKVARNLASAERERQAAQARIVAEDAAAERRLRMREGQLRLAAQRDADRDARAERRRKQREAERADRKARRQARRAELAGWWAGRVAYVRDNAAAVYSGLIYGLAVSGAVYGQVDAARANNLPTPIGVVAAVAIEGTGLAMALTAQQQRLKGERALVARSLVWVCTSVAVGINALGHHGEPVKAAGLSALSALGILVYEVRSGAKHRKALRELGMIPAPPERFGWRRWMTYPRETFAAWRVDVRERLSPGAQALIAQADARRAAKRARFAARRAEQRRLAAAEQERQRQQKVVAEVAERARKAAASAAKKGEAGPALAALVQLAHTGTPAPLLALPSRAHVEAEAAREELRTVRAALAEAEARTADAEARAEAETVRRAEAEAEAATAVREAEAEATRRAEAEAEAATAIRRAEAEAEARAVARRAEAEARTALERMAAEAEAANRRAEAEAVNRRKAEAEAATAIRRAEAEANATALARRAEAEARTALERMAAEAEAARAEARAEAGRAAHVQGQLDAAGVEWQRRLQAAEAAAVQARRELGEQQQARHRAEALAEAAKQEAADLRAALAQAAADAGRRTRRAPAGSSSKPAEPVLFEGKPVPHVDRVSAETVRAVLQARKDHPDATQKELAVQVSISERTVRTVLTAVAAAEDGHAS